MSRFNFSKRMLFLLVLMTCFAFSAGMAFATTTGIITGTVTDQSGAVIAGAKVTVSSPLTGFKQETVSSADGFYRVELVPVGIYEVAAEMSGFKRAVREQIALSVNDVLRIDFKLEVGQVSETITVEEKPSEVNTENATLGKTVDNKTLTDLPVLSGAGGRNPLNLAPLQAGVVAAGQVGPFAVNGQRAQSNNFLLDGGDSNDLAINVPDAVGGFSPDAMQEFRILTNTYNAEFGRNSGSIVNVISKSGTNSFHGNVFEFFRNRVLNATPFFNNSSPVFVGLRNPQFNVNEFGGTIGGPIKKDKMFFFFSYEGFRRRQGINETGTVPNAAQRALINQFGTASTKKLLALVPPASTGNTFFGSEPNKLRRDQIIAKVDYNFSDRNRLFVSVFDEKQSFQDPLAFGGSVLPGFGTNGTLRFTNAVINDTQILNDRMVNEFRFSYHRRGTLSVIPLNTTPVSTFVQGVIPDDPAADGPPRVDISGFSTFGNTIQGPQGRADNTWQISDNLSHHFGARHFMKYGADLRAYQQNQVFDFINTGLYQFTGGVSAQFGLPAIPGLTRALTDFANGVATDFIQNSAGRQGYRTKSANFYWQDDFKVKPSFTLNLGLRYEYNTNLTEVHDTVVTFRPGQQSKVFPTAPKGMVYVGDSGIPSSTYPNDYNNFSPRIGFAWDVLHNGKLSLRGGYGLFYDIVISETTLQFLTSPPFSVQPFTIFSPLNNPFTAALVNTKPQPFPFHPAKPGDLFDFTQFAPIGLTLMDPNFRTPYSHQFNLGIQYEFIKGYTLEVGYVGTVGIKLLSRREIDPAIPNPTASSGDTDARRVLNQNNPQNDAFGGAVYSGFTNQETSANSNFHSFQATVTKRFSHGFQFQNSYTWSHTIDDASGLRSNVRFNNSKADRSDSEQDVRQRYVVSYIWELPWGKGFTGAMGKLLDGWQISGVTSFQTGLPFNITEPEDRSLTSAGSDRPDFIGGTVQFFDPRNTDAANGGPNRFFNGTGGGSATAAANPFFRRVGSGEDATLGAGRFGNLGRNVFHGPGLNNWDFSILKRTKIRENQNLEFRAEFFNLWNHAQFLQPNGSIGSANFGRITGTQNPRLIQFAIKYNF